MDLQKWTGVAFQPQEVAFGDLGFFRVLKNPAFPHINEPIHCQLQSMGCSTAAMEELGLTPVVSGLQGISPASPCLWHRMSNNA